MSYRIFLNLHFVLPQIKHLTVDLGTFNKTSVVIDVDANDPDDACYLAFREFCETIIDQDSSKATKDLLKELKYDFCITQIIEL